MNDWLYGDKTKLVENQGAEYIKKDLLHMSNLAVIDSETDNSAEKMVVEIANMHRSADIFIATEMYNALGDKSAISEYDFKEAGYEAVAKYKQQANAGVSTQADGRAYGVDDVATKTNTKLQRVFAAAYDYQQGQDRFKSLVDHFVENTKTEIEELPEFGIEATVLSEWLLRLKDKADRQHNRRDIPTDALEDGMTRVWEEEGKKRLFSKAKSLVEVKENIEGDHALDQRAKEVVNGWIKQAMKALSLDSSVLKI